MQISERRHRRINVESYLKASYRDTGFELGRVTDLSEGGMRLCGHQPIQTSRTLSIKLNHSSDSARLSATIFKVRTVWCARVKSGDLFCTGVEFLDLDRHQAEIIDNFLEIFEIEDRWAPIIKDIDLSPPAASV